MSTGSIVRARTGVRTNPACPASGHGDAAAYRYGCRCPEAVEDWRLYNKRRRQKRNAPRVIDGTGTRRRLQALVAIGWTAPLIGARLDVTQALITRLYHRPRVNSQTAAAVRALYDELWNVPGPSWRSRYRARVAGWPPPLAWDDDTIDDPTAWPHRPRLTTTHRRRARTEINQDNVDRMCTGQPVTNTTPAENRAAVARLREFGMNDRQIAARTGLHNRTVLRIRAQLGLPAVPDAHLLGGVA